MSQDRFGYLPHKWTLKFKGGSISPVANFDRVKVFVHRNTNRDGYFYPPRSYLVSLGVQKRKVLKKVPRTERPAFLFRLPPSHKINLSARGKKENLRESAFGFIIHLVGYYFGTRLQFHNWYFDGRIPIESTHRINHTIEVAEDLLSVCYRTWRSWPDLDRKLITNVLYMHSRVPSYGWEWERFVVEFMVLDACYKLASRRYGVTSKTHAGRIMTMCRHFKIPQNTIVIDDIVRLRNELFHEALWDGSHPGTAVSSSALLRTLYLRKLNQRLIPALLNYGTAYVRSDWWTRGSHPFFKP